MPAPAKIHEHTCTRDAADLFRHLYGILSMVLDICVCCLYPTRLNRVSRLKETHRMGSRAFADPRP